MSGLRPLLLLVMLGTRWRHGNAFSNSGWDYVYGDSDTWDYDEEFDVCTFTEYEGYAIYGQNTATLMSTSVEECQKACVDSRTFVCASLDFNTQTSTCFISAYDRTSPQYGVHMHSVHYERSCESVVLSHGETAPPLKQGQYHRSRYDPHHTVNFAGTRSYKDGHCFNECGPIGDTFRHWPERETSDLEYVAHGNITGVDIKIRGKLESLQFIFGGSARGNLHVFEHVPGSITYSVTLFPGEYITAVSGQYQYAFSHLSFITNMRSIGTFGAIEQAGRVKFFADGKGKPLAYMSEFRASAQVHGPGYFKLFFYC